MVSCTRKKKTLDRVSCTRKKKTLDRIKGLDHTDRISELPDALLLDILSLLPTQDVVATMVLSKRWKFLRMFVPRLTYDRNMYKANEGRRFSHFLYTSLMLHESPFIESLDIKLGPKTGAIDIGVCVRTAIKRSVRHLDIEIDTSSTNTMVPVVLPVSLYTGATRLVTLALKNLVLMNTSSSVSFPSLKTLFLESIKYPTHDFVPMFLSSCPRLENLYVVRSPGDNVGLFIVRKDSLKLLMLYNKSYAVGVGVRDDGFLIDAPSLELLEMNEETLGFCGIEHNMPNIQVANVNVTCSHTGHILSSLVSVQQLELCLRTSKDTYPEGNIFSGLVRLHLCTCEPEWLNLLLCLLRDSPKLRILRLQHVHGGKVINQRPCWSKPSHVPQCLVSSLETFEWSQYQGREEEIEVARFILGNSGRLDMAAFYPKSTDPEEKLEMLMELSMSPRRSSICQLDFGRGTLTKIDILSDRHLSERLKDADF